MSDKRRDHRRRRDDDPDYDPSHRPAELRPRPSSPANTARSSEPVQAIVKWFDPLKGFGFVAAGGTEAFLHVSRLKAGGYSDLPEGSEITVRLGPGKRGPWVTELVEVGALGSTPSPKQAPSSPRPQAQDTPEEELVGSVKWYNSSKGFGFVTVGDGRKDVFVSGRVLERCGLNDLPEGRRVKMKVVQGHKGPEARSIRYVD